MNAASNSADDFIHENANGFSSDSDTNVDEETPEFYQPISAAADDDDDEELNFSDRQNSNPDDGSEHDHRFNSLHHPVPNGDSLHPLENGVLSLDLSDEDEDDCEEEERTTEESEVAMRRAFRDDDSRRNAPLTADNAARVIEAMRGVSFGGLAPDWVGRIPEDRWIDQLQRIRGPLPSATSTVQE